MYMVYHILIWFSVCSTLIWKIWHSSPYVASASILDAYWVKLWCCGHLKYWQFLEAYVFFESKFFLGVLCCHLWASLLQTWLESGLDLSCLVFFCCRLLFAYFWLKHVKTTLSIYLSCLVLYPPAYFCLLHIAQIINFKLRDLKI